MFIDFLHRFVIDHINSYYFCLMTYSIGRKYHCEIAYLNPWYDKMVSRLKRQSGLLCLVVYFQSFTISLIENTDQTFSL